MRAGAPRRGKASPRLCAALRRLRGARLRLWRHAHEAGAHGGRLDLRNLQPSRTGKVSNQRVLPAKKSAERQAGHPAGARPVERQHHAERSGQPD